MSHLPDHAPFLPEQRQAWDALLSSMTPEQTTWMSGYLAGRLAAGSTASEAVFVSATMPELTILYGTESGNSEELADATLKKAKAQGFPAKVYNMADYSEDQLATAENLLVLVSTWGDGDPPDSAVDFYEFVHSDAAPKLENTRFSVLALGDTSYEQFCKTGKDFDLRLEELGASRIHPRQDCDVDFDEAYEAWATAVLEAFKPAGQASGPASITTAPLPSASPAEYSKKNPFPAELTERILLNGTGAQKEIYHLEFSLEGSGLSYEVGDSLGVVPSNDPVLVDAILEKTGLDPEAAVESPAEGSKPLRQALIDDFELTSLSSNLFEAYAKATRQETLLEQLEPSNKDALVKWLYGRGIADLVFEYPANEYTPELLTGLLRKLPGRLYSIASSLSAHPGEVHLTVGAVRYERYGVPMHGVCSSYLADRISPGDTIPVYTQPNKSFNLPDSDDTPIIMVGPGTGIAPFRAFVEERAQHGASGNSWLFFGDQHFQTDFLYQLEWQEYLKDGLLTRLNTAFSRDQEYKIYVQHRMIEEGAALYDWLESGAHFYVCGDASRMAKDVHEALIQIIETHGDQNRESAEAYVKNLQKEKRYQRDVY